jgi:hypothetical protein
MVADGTISVEQGAELLDALESQKTQTAQSPSRPTAGPNWGWGELLGEVLSRGLGRRLGDNFAVPRPQPPRRPPRPPRPPRSPHRSRREEPGPFGRSGRHVLSFEELVELKTQGVARGYIEEMRDVFPDIGTGELLECHESGLEPSYALAMRATFGDLDVAQLVELDEAGVTVEFAAALLSEFPDLDPSSIIEAVEEGIDAEDLDFFATRGSRPRPASYAGSQAGPVAGDDRHDSEEHQGPA